MEAIKEIPQWMDGLIYKGRQTNRAGSDQRRRAILEAALRIIVRDGIRGVRHRAVAREANVPLSSTTYYFESISDLISDTFTLFVDSGAAKFRSYWKDSHKTLHDTMTYVSDSPESGQQLVNTMTDLAVVYVMNQLRHHREYLMAEQAFNLECLRNESLRPIAFKHQQYILNDLVDFFKQIGSDNIEMDARLMLAAIMTVEYEGLLQNPDNIDETIISRFLHRQITLILSHTVRR
ncbi:MAG: TetR family transcriptional regulator [Endozoicomonadaceae bacterium]|nr:TetR family transcriptional regulator [Endozoicomonadaceae bacterium]